MRVEISVESVDGVRVAARAGAARVEVCAGLSDGGLTPSAALSEAAAELAEVHVLVLQQLARNWDGSDIRLHHYQRPDGRRTGGLRPAGRARAGFRLPALRPRDHLDAIDDSGRSQARQRPELSGLRQRSRLSARV